MIRTAVWTVAVAGILVPIVRGNLRLSLLWTLMLGGLIAGAVIRHAYLRGPAFDSFIEAAAEVGWGMLAGAVAVLVIDFIALAVCKIRPGRRQTAVTTAKITRLGNLTSLDAESLANGTATFGQRMCALATGILLICLFLVFVASGLILMQHVLPLMLLPVIPGVFVYRNFSAAWQEYREVRIRSIDRSAAATR